MLAHTFALAPSLVAHNLSVFGFTSEGQSLVQVAKELLDNSLDACRQIDPPAGSEEHEVTVTVGVDSADSEFVYVTVTDTGCGVKDPSSFLEYFSTDKLLKQPAARPVQAKQQEEKQELEPDMLALSGRFGVGLSVCLLYSSRATAYQHALRIVSRCSDSHLLRGSSTAGSYLIADYSTNPQTGRPCMLQSKRLYPEQLDPAKPPPPKYGTSITVYVPRPSDAALSAALVSINGWLDRLCRVPGSLTAIIKSIAKIPVMKTIFEGAEWNVEKKYCYQQKPANTANYERMIAAIHEAALGVGEYCHASTACLSVRNGGLRVKVTALLISTDTTADAANLGDASVEGILPLQVWRYANSSPLLDSEADANTADCSMRTAVTSRVRWHLFGHSAQLKGPVPGMLVLEPGLPEREKCAATDLFPATQWQRAVRLTVVVALEGEASDVPGTGLQWAGLSKRAVAGDAAKRLVASATEQSMAALHQKLTGITGLAALFLSTRQQRLDLMATRNVSAVTEAMSQLLGRMSPDVLDRLSLPLGLPVSAPVTNTATGELEAAERVGGEAAVQGRLRELLLQGLARKHPSVAAHLPLPLPLPQPSQHIIMPPQGDSDTAVTGERR